jgi:uncharacterized membrane protein YkvA (DUF1232 family)
MKQGRRPLSDRRADASGIVIWFQQALRQAQLAWRLLLDERVPFWTKLIPPAALLYVLSPLDIIPDVFIGLGQLDDIAVVLIGVKLFIELAPPEVVREHLAKLSARASEWRVVDEEPPQTVVIEGELEPQDSEAVAEERG